MDPNATLSTIRAYLLNHDRAPDSDPEGTLDGLAEHVQALDEWLSRGGFLPDAWAAER